MTDADLTKKLDELGYNSPRLFFFCKSLLAAGASEGQADRGEEAVYQIRSCGAWRKVAQWVYESTPDIDRRIVYAAPIAPSADSRDAALERLRAFMAEYQEDWSDENLNALLDAIAAQRCADGKEGA